jgi:adenylate cyclase class 2
MYEVEVKVRATHEPVRERLETLGATAQGTVRQVDTYYDAPDREFAETDEALRIRREEPANGEPVARVTYKGPLIEAESKTREEAETVVADDEAMAAILAGLGYEPAATVEKHRERFAYDGYDVTLDDVAGLGEFVEVEAETDGEVEPVREGAYEVLEALDLDPEEQLRTSYLGLLLAERDEQQ